MNLKLSRSLTIWHAWKDEHDQRSVEKWLVGGVAELPFGSVVDAQVGKDMRRGDHTGEHTRGLSALAHKLSVRDISGHHLAKRCQNDQRSTQRSPLQSDSILHE